MIHLPLSPHSPVWRQVSASFKTENFKWISFITHSPHATMNRSITLSTGGKPAPCTHIYTHSCSVLKFPYYQRAGNDTAFQMFNMKSLLTLNKLAFLLPGAVNHHGALEETALARCNGGCWTPSVVWTVGGNKGHTSSVLLLSPFSLQFIWPVAVLLSQSCCNSKQV